MILPLLCMCLLWYKCLFVNISSIFGDFFIVLKRYFGDHSSDKRCRMSLCLFIEKSCRIALYCGRHCFLIEEM